MFPTGCQPDQLRDLLWNLSKLSPPSPGSRPDDKDDSPPRVTSPTSESVEMLRSKAPSQLKRHRDQSRKKKAGKERLRSCQVLLERAEDVHRNDLCPPCVVNIESMDQSFLDKSCDVQSSDDDDLIPATQATTIATNRSLIKSFYEFESFNDEDEAQPSFCDASPTSEEADKVLEAIESGPTRGDIVDSFETFGLHSVRHPEATCSRREDAPEKGIELGLQRISLRWAMDLEEAPSFFQSLKECRKVCEDRFKANFGSDVDLGSVLGSNDIGVYQSVKRAPSRGKIEQWIRIRQAMKAEDLAKESLSCSMKSCDQDFDDPDERDVINSSQMVLRVRRDSNDSMGSELTCSPPSSPTNESLITSSNDDNSTSLRKRRVSWADEGPSTSKAALNREHESIALDSQTRQKYSTPQQSFCSRIKSKLRVNAIPTSPIEGPTMDNSHEFKLPKENLLEAKALHAHSYMTVMSMELHTLSRQNLLPDPEFDPIAAFFFVISNDVPDTSSVPRKLQKIYVMAEEEKEENGSSFLQKSGVLLSDITYFTSETELIHALIAETKRADPEILVGYEVQMSSWGYLIERGARLNINVAPLLSRLPSKERDSKMNEETDPYGADHTSELRIAGRIVLNIWRLMRHEVAFYSYTFENMMFHVLHQRVSKFSFATLSSWWRHPTHLLRARVVDYYLLRVNGNLELLEQLDLIGRTSELARLFGIQFFEVLSRGSQFRVESLMLRMTKRRNNVPVSPSIQQRAGMKAPEYIPLVMEPESRFYTDPVLVLDFQSLYPSIIMAYNYCYSTCLGRLQHMGGEQAYAFGATQLKISPKRLSKLLDHVTFSPGGSAFVTPDIKKGVLPQMLHEILTTRLMVKKSMKLHKDDKTLQRVLHARQLGLKLIANVTYGYTSANFSGRMPCVEVADSVVSKGRETLERCIKTIHDTPRWRAKVVYGDTDSVFVMLPGRSKDEVFKIGEEIAQVVTNDNPKPVKLKFEKVYYPCILQTKKRYVGYMYETRDQKEPVYDAKGIETVRRDGCPAVVKVLERSLRILFETKDVSKVRLYVQRQFQKIVQNRASLQDLTFAKEFRGIKGYRPGAVVPALELTRRFLRRDRRAMPRSGQRVPYIIVYGVPGQPLIQSVRTPMDLVEDANLRPNAHYYITKVLVPPLNRCLTLVGANAMSWYTEMPKFFRPRLVDPKRAQEATPGPSRPNQGQGIILNYFASHHCAVCDQLSQTPICSSCQTNPQNCAHTLTVKMHQWDRTKHTLGQICNNCCQFQDFSKELLCTSLDCPVFYRRFVANFDADQIQYVQDLLTKLSF